MIVTLFITSSVSLFANNFKGENSNYPASATTQKLQKDIQTTITTTPPTLSTSSENAPAIKDISDRISLGVIHKESAGKTIELRYYRDTEKDRIAVVMKTEDRSYAIGLNRIENTRYLSEDQRSPD